MGVLIFTPIACALWNFGIIGDYLCFSILVGLVAWMYIGTVLYFRFGFLKFYYHNILGWHYPKNFDGHFHYATCKHCKKEIMRDSQGNWFKK